MSVDYYFKVIEHFKSIPRVCVVKKTDDEEFTCGSFKLPKKGKIRLYIVRNYCFVIDTIFFLDINEKDDYNKIYLKMFSQIHKCLPFEITKYDRNNKEEGYYPKELTDMENILDKDILKQMIGGDYEYYFFVVNSKGKEIDTKLFFPKP